MITLKKKKQKGLEKVERKVVKHHWFHERAMKYFFDDAWCTNRCAEVDDALVVVIWTNALLLQIAYPIPLCKTAPTVYKFNMKVTIEKHKAKKQSKYALHFVLIEPIWVHWTNLHSIPIEWLTLKSLQK
jgi:hypothetical protein